MASLSNLTQSRAQSLIGGIDKTVPGEMALFALERGKRAAVDFLPASIAAIIIWTQLVSAGTWSIVHIPIIVAAVGGFYAFYDGVGV